MGKSYSVHVTKTDMNCVYRLTLTPLKAAMKSIHMTSFNPPAAACQLYINVFMAPSNLRYHHDITGKNSLIIAPSWLVAPEVMFTTWISKVARDIP